MDETTANPYAPPKAPVEILPEWAPHSRKELLPKWILFFSWLFLPCLAVAPIALVVGLAFGLDPRFEIFGLSHHGPVTHPLGLFCIALFFGLGVAAFGLLWSKSWGLDAGIWVGTVGLLICVVVMVLSKGSDIRFEPLLQIPFLAVLHQKRAAWHGFTPPGLHSDA